ncbi:unnamed protein product [Lepeophtheirus salmonis]|uniref:(salmon louse) hypothetical protein n=1 Tax=Lepeophtheirus salmonis TaxID=72036 RepID=A0A7R8CYA8_LEPSM|nr:unnamed protein product [Lepeophtheirus salmonis]CAF2967968.1 unnamed protein product [Lepeophtheirus salmonis]
MMKTLPRLTLKELREECTLTEFLFIEEELFKLRKAELINLIRDHLIDCGSDFKSYQFEDVPESLKQSTRHFCHCECLNYPCFLSDLYNLDKVMPLGRCMESIDIHSVVMEPRASASVCMSE